MAGADGIAPALRRCLTPKPQGIYFLNYESMPRRELSSPIEMGIRRALIPNNAYCMLLRSESRKPTLVRIEMSLDVWLTSPATDVI